MRLKITCLIAGMLLSALIMETSVKPTANPESHVFEMVLRPVTNGQREVKGIVVHQEIHGTPAADGTPFTLIAPVTYAGVTHVADRIQSLDVHDAKGQISFKIEDDKPAQGGFPYYRHWRAERAVQFPVTVDYEALVQPAGSPNGPPFGIRPSGGGSVAQVAAFCCCRKMAERTYPESGGT